MTLRFYILNNGIISNNGMSGSDQRALNLAKIFIKRGYPVTMVIPESGRDRYKGFDCLLISRGDLLTKLGLFITYLYRALRVSGALLKKIKMTATDNLILYSSSDLLPDAMPAICAKIKNPQIKWISGLHLIAPNPFKGFKKISTAGYALPAISNIYYFLSQRLIIRFMKQYAYMVMVSNSIDKAFLVKKGFTEDKVVLTYGAVNWEEVHKAEKKAIEYDACFVGRFHKQKGFPDLMESWKIVCKKYPNAVMAIIGNDVNFKGIINKVKNAGLARNMRFLGFLSGMDKFNVMKSSKMCIFPSTYESFGMVIAEAMACGLPVIAYDLPIYKEIYPGGILITETGDIEKLAGNIIGLLCDEAKRKKLSQDAYKISREFTWERVAEGIIKKLA